MTSSPPRTSQTGSPKYIPTGFKQTHRTSPHLKQNNCPSQYILNAECSEISSVQHKQQPSDPASTSAHPYSPAQSKPIPNPARTNSTAKPSTQNEPKTRSPALTTRSHGTPPPTTPRPQPQRLNHRLSRTNASSSARWIPCSSALRTAR